MVQYYSLEEAAKRLHTSADQLREMINKGELNIRPFRDGRGNWQFMATQIDEEARRRGLGSDVDQPAGAAPAALPRSSGKLAPPEDSDAVFADDPSGAP